MEKPTITIHISECDYWYEGDYLYCHNVGISTDNKYWKWTSQIEFMPDGSEKRTDFDFYRIDGSIYLP